MAAERAGHQARYVDVEIKRGGGAVSAEDLESSLDTIIDAPAFPQQASLVRESDGSYAADQRAPGFPTEDASKNEAADPFPSGWPQSAAFLSKPRTAAEVADEFHLQTAQAQAWLRRAIDLGLVRKLSKPTRFERIHAADDAQASLFEP